MSPKESLRFVLEANSRIPLSDQIVAHFETLVLAGKIPHNFRLPSGQRLAKEWECSYVTVQKAMKELVAKGLAHRKPQKGTFINVPDLTRFIAVLIGPNLSSPSAAYFRALASGIADRISKSDQWPPSISDSAPTPLVKRWAVRIYDDMHSADNPRHSGVRNLKEDLKRHDFAGRIEIGCGMAHYSFLKPFLPKAFANHSLFGCSEVLHDLYDFTFSSVEYLAQRQGVQRIVYFRTYPETPNSYRDCNGVFDACAANGLPVPEVRQLRFDKTCGSDKLDELAHQEALLYFQNRKGMPKTGVIVSDDIAARGIAIALIRLRLDHPDSVCLLTSANESIDYFYGMPVAKYEKRISTIVEHLTANLWRQIIGKPTGETVHLRGTIRPLAESHRQGTGYEPQTISSVMLGESLP